MGKKPEILMVIGVATVGAAGIAVGIVFSSGGAAALGGVLLGTALYFGADLIFDFM